MQLLLTFIAKEFKHILRDKRTLLILFGLPIVQILLFGFALTNEVKNSRIAILDHSTDEMTLQIANRLSASAYFDVDRMLQREEEIDAVFRRDEVKMVIVFPSNFRETLLHTHKADIQLIIDGSDPNTATSILNYATAIINDYQESLQGNPSLPLTITTETRMLYNPQLKGSYNFVPGVIALILMLVCVLMTSVAIVREKELGTMEVLLVSPMRPAILIIAKMVPYLVLSFVIVGIILVMGVTLLDVPIRGSLPLLLGESLLFILTCLAIGLLISNFTRTQQTAMLITLLGMMMPTLVFSGFMFPIENMPIPLQLISNAIPSKWYFYVVQAIMIKGLHIESIWRETLILTGMTLFFLLVSLKKFSIRLT
ncbi:MAG: ABC transporter permease [Ignavibacteriae bacterium]|nr:ABC transporter permease [Ignavibacteriota bacterium]MCB9214543.1 ABC transporter permease [Ignavibacteria bacterium]